MIRSRLLVLSLCGLLGALLLHAPAHAQDRSNQVPRVSPNATVSQTVGVTEVSVSYGRPSVNGRTIFGDLVPFDEVWRTGANEATTFSVSTPVQIEGNSLEAGTYGFFTIPGKDTWTLIFNETADQWGAYNYDSSKDALRIEVEPESADSREMMTFSFEAVTDTSATCVLHWAETRVPFRIDVNTVEILRGRAEQAMADASDWRTPLRYVGYALENEVLLDEALGWANRSIEIEETFYNLRMKAEVLAAQNQYENAVQAADAAIQKASSMEEPPDGLDDFRGTVEDWKEEM